MTYLRHAKKVDLKQPGIVADLEACGYHVVVLGLPVDLLVRHKTWPSNKWVLLEIKTPSATGKVVNRADRKDQADFCATHGVPYVFETEQALAYLRNFGRAGAGE